jgi:hypothetical protein
MLTTILFFLAYAFAASSPSPLPLDKELKKQIEKLFELSQLDHNNLYKSIFDYWNGDKLIFDELIHIQILDLLNK